MPLRLRRPNWVGLPAERETVPLSNITAPLESAQKQKKTADARKERSDKLMITSEPKRWPSLTTSNIFRQWNCLEVMFDTGVPVLNPYPCAESQPEKGWIC